MSAPNSFTSVFGAAPVYPANPSYLSLTLNSNVVLAWPTEINPGNGNILADIIDVDAAQANLSVQLSDATQVSEGYSALFVNVGSFTFTVKDNSGNTLASIASGQAWQIYLRNNGSAAGIWGIFQYGAGASSANAGALAGAGLLAITTTLNEQMVIQAKSANYTIQNSDRATVVEWTSGAGTFTLPAPGSLQAGWFVAIKNAGSGTLTITPTSGNIDGLSTLSFSPLGSAWIVFDGTNFWSLGIGGGGGGSSFGFTTINLGGLSGTYTISGSQLNQIGYRFIGALAGNIAVVVPATVQEYWVDNETSGAYTLSVGVSGQSSPSPPQVLQGTRAILYCDGANVYNAVSGTLTLPITPVQGGTGLTSIAAGSLLYASASNTISQLAGIINTSTLGWSIPAPSSGVTLSLLAASSGAGTSITVSPGSVGSPALAIAGSLNTGTYSPAANQIGWATNGVGAGFFDGSQNLNLTNPLAISFGGTGAATAGTARANLGVTATGGDATYLYRANNLSDLNNAANAVSNLGLAQMSQSPSGLTLVQRSVGGYAYATYFNQNSLPNENPPIGSVAVMNNTLDGFFRFAGLAYFMQQALLSGAVTIAPDPGTTPTGQPGQMFLYY